MTPQEEIRAALDWAVFMWWEERDDRTWSLHPDCPCTVQVDNPMNVHMWLVFSCPRHGEHTQWLRERLGAQQ